jgi:diguanylate cyclase (GGDEF)-like protein
LAKEGLGILSAASGKAGLEIARRDKPDLILLDVDMPDMSGFDVCRTLKQDLDLCMIPVVFLTASDNTDDKIKGLDLGAVDYVTKPFNAFELRARVRAALRTKRLQDLLIQYSHIDPLTELWNRRALMERLRQEWARYRRHGVPFAVIVADLDNFKSVNDRFGHSIGDQLLQEVGKVFIEQSRDCDLPVRHGGEEFAVLLPGECAEGATHLADRCRQKVEEIRLTAENDTAVQTTASFGVADITGRSSGEDLIKRADEALYQAKSRGRNRVEQAEPPKDEPVAPGRGRGTVLT